jgi:hypothetical protein
MKEYGKKKKRKRKAKKLQKVNMMLEKVIKKQKMISLSTSQ